MGLFVQPVGEGVQFGPQLRWQLVAEPFEPVADLWDLRPPFVRVDPQGGGEVVGGQVKAIGVNGGRMWHKPDRGVDRVGATFESLNDPLQDAGVLTVARPEEPAVAVRRNQFTWKIFGSFDSSVACLPIVSQWLR